MPRLVLLVGALFEAFAVLTKATPTLYDHAPWENDPYDTLWSFAEFWVPLCGFALLCALVAPGRTADSHRRLRRTSLVLLGVVDATLLSCWAATLTLTNRPSWSPATGLQLALVGLLTVAAVPTTALAVRLPNPPEPPTDLLDDFPVLGRLAPLRRHPIATAGALSVAAGLLAGTSESISEGYDAEVAIVVVTLIAVGLFGFLLAAGSTLSFLRPDPPLGRVARRAVVAISSASAGTLLTLAFRHDLRWIVPPDTPGRFALLLAIGGAVSFAAAWLLLGHLLGQPDVDLPRHPPEPHGH